MYHSEISDTKLKNIQATVLLSQHIWCQQKQSLLLHYSTTKGDHSVKMCTADNNNNLQFM